MGIIPLFPSVIHNLSAPSQFKKNQDDLIRFAYKKRKEDPKGRVISNEGGWQSYSLSLKENLLTDFILHTLNDYFTQNKLLHSWIRVTLLNAWVNINNKGHSNSAHIHGGSTLSGVFYLKVPENSGKIVFQSPHDYTYHRERISYTDEVIKALYHYHDFWYTPQEGCILLFPSNLLHKVSVNQSRQDRISVSFNLELDDVRSPEEAEKWIQECGESV